MKILFSKQGKSCYMVDKEKIIFCIDKFVNDKRMPIFVPELQ